MIYYQYVNNLEGKVKIKFVFTFYFMSFWPVLELHHTEILCFSLVDFLWISNLENGSKKFKPPNICHFENACL